MAIPEWLHLSELSGSGNKTITITADTYTGDVDRTSDVVAYGDTETATLHVTQWCEGEITLSDSYVLLDASGGTTAITYTANDVPQLSLNNNNFTATLGQNNTIVITAPIVPSTSNRAAILTVNVRGVTATATIIQSGAVFTVSGSSAQTKSTASTNGSFAISGNVQWKPASSESWLSITDTSVRQPEVISTIPYRVSSNSGEPREGNIIATWGDSFQYSTPVASVSQTGKTYIYVYYTTTDHQTITPRGTGWSSTTYTDTGATLYRQLTSLGYFGFNVSGNTTLETVRSEAKLDPRMNNCTSLKEVYLPNSRSTNSGSFSACTQLTSATLNQYTFMISFFNGCTNLQRFVSTYVEETNRIYLERGSFMNCSSLQYLEFNAPKGGQIYSGSNPFGNSATGGTMVYPAGSDYAQIINVLPQGWTTQNTPQMMMVSRVKAFATPKKVDNPTTIKKNDNWIIA